MRKPSQAGPISFGRPLGSASERLKTVGADRSRRKALSRPSALPTAYRCRRPARHDHAGHGGAGAADARESGSGETVVTILAVRTALAVGTMRAVAALRLLGLLLRLAAGDERRQTLDVFIIDLLMLRPRLAVALSLRLMLLARIKRLQFARRERLAADGGLVVAVVISLVGNIAALVAALLVIGLALPKLFLGGGDQAEIMLGVLIVIFGRHGVAGTLRIARKLEIFFRDVRRRTADLHVRSVDSYMRDNGFW